MRMKQEPKNKKKQRQTQVPLLLLLKLIPHQHRYHLLKNNRILIHIPQIVFALGRSHHEGAPDPAVLGQPQQASDLREPVADLPEIAAPAGGDSRLHQQQLQLRHGHCGIQHRNNIIEIHVGGSSIKEILLPTIPILSASLSQQLQQSYTLSIVVVKSQNTKTESFIDHSNPETVLNNIIKENEAVLELKEKLNLHLIYK